MANCSTRPTAFFLRPGVASRVGKISQEAFWKKLKFIPTPYPVDLPAWDFSTPLEQREGILIGTREFKTEARNHIHAITRAASLAHEFDIRRVTVINSDKARGMSILRELQSAFPPGCLHIYETTLPYPDYMKLLSSHRIVYQMDRSTVPARSRGIASSPAPSAPAAARRSRRWPSRTSATMARSA